MHISCNTDWYKTGRIDEASEVCNETHWFEMSLKTR